MKSKEHIGNRPGPSHIALSPVLLGRLQSFHVSERYIVLKQQYSGQYHGLAVSATRTSV